MLWRQIRSDLGPVRPAHANTRKGPRNQEAIPRFENPGSLRLKMKCSYGCARDLCQLDRAHFGSVNRSARPVRGEDRCTSRLDDVSQTQQPFARPTGTGAAHSIEAEHPENSRDEFAVEAVADQDHSTRSAKIKRAGKHA